MASRQAGARRLLAEAPRVSWREADGRRGVGGGAEASGHPRWVGPGVAQTPQQEHVGFRCVILSK